MVRPGPKSLANTLMGVPGLFLRIGAVSGLATGPVPGGVVASGSLAFLWVLLS